MTDPLRRRPPERTLRWAAESLGSGSRIVAVRRMTEGGWHANHALTIVDPPGRVHRVVLRRWARAEWRIEDPDFTVEREATVLDLLSGAPVPTPRVLAADPTGSSCDVPALLLTRLPGRPPGLPRNMGSFLAQLAAALPVIQGLDGAARERVPGYRGYHDPRSAAPPAWTDRPGLWEHAIEVASVEPPAGRRCFIHRDYHPENTLWSRGRLTGVVDWTSGSWGPAAVDTAHMRWNLAVTYGLDAAEEFLRCHRSLTSEALPGQPYWDVVTVLDLVRELDASDWPAFDLARIERYVASVLGRS